MSLTPGLYPGCRLRSSSSLSDRVKHASQRALFRTKYLLSRMANVRKIHGSQQDSGCEMCIEDGEDFPASSSLAEQVVADLDRREKLRRRKIALDHRQRRLDFHDSAEFWHLEEIKLDLVEGLNDLECRIRTHDRRACVDDSVRWWTVMQEQIAERKIFATQEFARLHKQRSSNGQPDISTSASMTTTLQHYQDLCCKVSSNVPGQSQSAPEGIMRSYPAVPMAYILSTLMEHWPVPMFWKDRSLERERGYSTGREPVLLC